jgi:hypothetical protein
MYEQLARRGEHDLVAELRGGDDKVGLVPFMRGDGIVAFEEHSEVIFTEARGHIEELEKLDDVDSRPRGWLSLGCEGRAAGAEAVESTTLISLAAVGEVKACFVVDSWVAMLLPWAVAAAREAGRPVAWAIVAPGLVWRLS